MQHPFIIGDSPYQYEVNTNIDIDEYRKKYEDTPIEERLKVLFVIDSIGMLQTSIGVDQISNGEIKGDMGHKPKQLKAFITNCINTISQANIGMVVTNHSYESQNIYDPDQKISGGCLISGTKIFLSNENLIDIDKVQIGDKVKTLFGSEKVINLWHYKKTTFILEFDDEKIYECSPEHKFLVQKNEGNIWVCAKDLSVNDYIISI